ncbi:MAG: 50S ribosomal protein L23 [Gaiellaceae bacterium]
MKLDPTQILIAPVVSEKSYHMINARQYSFRVHQDAHKLQVRQAVEAQFGVQVESVNIVSVPSKPKRRGVSRGRRPGWKKAIVKLRDGYSIEIFQGAQV